MGASGGGMAQATGIHSKLKRNPGRLSVRGIFMPTIQALIYRSVNVRGSHRARDRGQLVYGHGSIRNVRGIVRITMEQVFEVKSSDGGEFRQVVTDF